MRHSNWFLQKKDYLYASSRSLWWSASSLWSKGIQSRARCIISGDGTAFSSPMSRVGSRSGRAFNRVSCQALYPKGGKNVLTDRVNNKCINKAGPDRPTNWIIESLARNWNLSTAKKNHNNALKISENLTVANRSIFSDTFELCVSQTKVGYTGKKWLRTHGRTDGPTDWRTDTPSYKVVAHD